MDLRTFDQTQEHRRLMRYFSCRGLFCYQPFIFADDLEVGAGYEFSEAGEMAGMVYCPDVPPEDQGTDKIDRLLVDPAKRDLFRAENAKLRALYDHMVDFVIDHVGSGDGMSMAEVGCNTGYFPQSFSRRGYQTAVGYDRTDFSRAFQWLNEVLGTNATFIKGGYNQETRTLVGEDQYDVVFSVAVLCHMSEPLQHLTLLGRMAKKALFVWVPTDNKETERTIRFNSNNRYDLAAVFPYNFDFVTLSKPLIEDSLRMMGFTKIVPIENCPDGYSDEWFNNHVGYLALRP